MTVTVVTFGVLITLSFVSIAVAKYSDRKQLSVRWFKFSVPGCSLSQQKSQATGT